MTDINTLRAQRDALDRSIAEQKRIAVQQVRDLMTVLGVTVEDLGGKMPSNRPAKFRDEKGQTWTGIGQRPRWLRIRLAAGATLDQFRVRG
jgi:DNA-binding protein H-NS